MLGSLWMENVNDVVPEHHGMRYSHATLIRTNGYSNGMDSGTSGGPVADSNSYVESTWLGMYGYWNVTVTGTSYGQYTACSNNCSGTVPT